MSLFLAHARPLPDGGFEVHHVEDHLRAVAAQAGQFAERFGSANWAQVAGLWHDLGKYHPEFQSYIGGATGYDPDAHIEGGTSRVDHSTLGAIYACDRLGDLGRILAYVISGHHSGLPDYESAEQGGTTLVQRMARNRERMEPALRQPIPQDILSPEFLQSPFPGGSPALWIRMIFSCLVDADYLDTERFLELERSALRGRYPSIGEIHRRFNSHMSAKEAALRQEGPLSRVNEVRAEVLQQSRAAASLHPGLFSLSVPTGGGKTLSSLAWALEHARVHGRQRIIYVIPFTSIIEQTADEFRDALGDVVVEHHTNLEPTRETHHNRSASENWDAPVIVTTAVQFWESLFAARTNRTRKLHNIVDSVVVLDEAQTLPPEFLRPILAVTRDLQEYYGVSFLLCTATQPALEARHGFDSSFEGLEGVREIIADPERLHRELKRVELTVPADLRNPITLEDLAGDIAAEESALCIVNRRDDARDLYRLLPEASRVHLSALMCGEHRSRTLRSIRERLKSGERLHVVSTQLVEAGVDLDFPVVFRALAGLDSIAQAAGRCNREGHLERGRVFVFVPPKPSPPGLLRMAEDGGRQSLQERPPDPLAPERFRSYFRELYWKHGDRLDRHQILRLLGDHERLSFSFRTAAERFRMIPETQLPVVVRYENDALLAQLEEIERRGGEPDRLLRRRLQRFIVSIPRYVHQQVSAAGKIREVFPGTWVQEWPSMYDHDLGLSTENPEIHEAADLIG